MPETARERSERRITQVCFFLPNRLGTLRQAVAKLEEGGVRLCAISVQDAADYAVVRIVANDPKGAAEQLRAQGLGLTSTEILAVSLPTGGKVGVGRILADLYAAEVNVEYVYSLHEHVNGRAVLALQVDSQEMAARVLSERGFDLVGQDDLSWNPSA